MAKSRDGFSEPCSTGHERAFWIGDLYGDPRTLTFAKLLIDLEE